MVGVVPLWRCLLALTERLSEEEQPEATLNQLASAKSKLRDAPAQHSHTWQELICDHQLPLELVRACARLAVTSSSTPSQILAATCAWDSLCLLLDSAEAELQPLVLAGQPAEREHAQYLLAFLAQQLLLAGASEKRSDAILAAAEVLNQAALSAMLPASSNSTNAAPGTGSGSTSSSGGMPLPEQTSTGALAGRCSSSITGYTEAQSAQADALNRLCGILLHGVQGLEHLLAKNPTAAALDTARVVLALMRHLSVILEQLPADGPPPSNIHQATARHLMVKLHRTFSEVAHVGPDATVPLLRHQAGLFVTLWYVQYSATLLPKLPKMSSKGSTSGSGSSSDEDPLLTERYAQWAWRATNKQQAHWQQEQWLQQPGATQPQPQSQPQLQVQLRAQAQGQAGRPLISYTSDAEVIRNYGLSTRCIAWLAAFSTDLQTALRSMLSCMHGAIMLRPACLAAAERQQQHQQQQLPVPADDRVSDQAQLCIDLMASRLLLAAAAHRICRTEDAAAVCSAAVAVAFTALLNLTLHLDPRQVLTAQSSAADGGSLAWQKQQTLRRCVDLWLPLALPVTLRILAHLLQLARQTAAGSVQDAAGNAAAAAGGGAAGSSSGSSSDSSTDHREHARLVLQMIARAASCSILQVPEVDSAGHRTVRLQFCSLWAQHSAQLGAALDEVLRLQSVSGGWADELSLNSFESTLTLWSKSDAGPLILAAHEAAPGSPQHLQLFSVMCSSIKVSALVRPHDILKADRCYWHAAAAAAQLLKQSSAVAAAAANDLDDDAVAADADADADAQRELLLQGDQLVSSSDAASAPDATSSLPWLVIFGRCCLHWAQQLSQLQQQHPDLGHLLQQMQVPQPDLMALLEGNPCHAAGVLLQGPQAAFLGHASACRAWLLEEHNATQLAALGYTACGDRPGCLIPLLDVVLALADWAVIQTDHATAAGALGQLAQHLEALGLALNNLPIPHACNNPFCSNLSGPSETALVSGKSAVCARCRVARYCSRDCQAQHYKLHKKACKAMAAAAAGVQAGQ